MYELTSFGLYIGFLISSVGSGPDIDTVSKIGVYETKINHFFRFDAR